MAQDSTTPLGFRTRTEGVVAHQQTTRANALKADELIAALTARVEALETFQSQVEPNLDDSNSALIDNN